MGTYCSCLNTGKRNDGEIRAFDGKKSIRIETIVRLQKAMRGFLARKKVQHIKGGKVYGS